MLDRSVVRAAGSPGSSGRNGLFLEGPFNKPLDEKGHCRSMRDDALHGTWLLGIHVSK
jgi:hypothetical protein